MKDRRNFSVKIGKTVIKINWDNYDSWRTASGHEDMDAIEKAVSDVIDEYRSTPEFFEDAVNWAIKKGLNVETHENLEDGYLESEDCWDHCASIVEWKRGAEYDPSDYI